MAKKTPRFSGYAQKHPPGHCPDNVQPLTTNHPLYSWGDGIKAPPSFNISFFNLTTIITKNVSNNSTFIKNYFQDLFIYFLLLFFFIIIFHGLKVQGYTQGALFISKGLKLYSFTNLKIIYQISANVPYYYHIIPSPSSYNLETWKKIANCIVSV